MTFLWRTTLVSTVTLPQHWFSQKNTLFIWSEKKRSSICYFGVNKVEAFLAPEKKKRKVCYQYSEEVFIWCDVKLTWALNWAASTTIPQENNQIKLGRAPKQAPLDSHERGGLSSKPQRTFVWCWRSFIGVQVQEGSQQICYLEVD